MDNELKIAQYYDSDKMRIAVMKMEQFYYLSTDKNLDEENKLLARKLFEHYRRMAMCVLMKDFSPDFSIENVVSVDYMRDQYKGYAK